MCFIRKVHLHLITAATIYDLYTTHVTSLMFPGPFYPPARPCVIQPVYLWGLPCQTSPSHPSLDPHSPPTPPRLIKRHHAPVITLAHLEALKAYNLFGPWREPEMDF